MNYFKPLAKILKPYILIGSAILAVSPAVASDIADVSQALTFAQVRDDQGRYQTLLVTADKGEQVEAVNASMNLSDFSKDSLDLVSRHGYSVLARLAISEASQSYNKDNLLTVAGSRSVQIAAGTNYAKHGEETDLDEVFLFPKYSRATGSRSKLTMNSEQLIDYEVELCARFDRDVKTKADFESSYKGFFLCGDMTDRATMLRNINLEHITSGHGFSDAKSGPGRFPTGPFLLVPKHWQSFIEKINISTFINGDKKQDAKASEMIKPLPELVDEILEKGKQPNWRFKGKPVPLINEGHIVKGQSILMGTPEGVIFNAPSAGYKVLKSIKWIATLAFVDHGSVEYILQQYIEDNLADKSYLQPGTQIQYTGNYLGNIQVQLIQ